MLNRYLDRFKDWFTWKFNNPYGLNQAMGQCPVQIEGTLRDGLYYYFRARGSHWSFTLYTDRGGSVLNKPLFQYTEPYGETFEAGWILKREAIRFGTLALDKYYGQCQIYT
jgi:hypothetical protein